MFKKTSRVIAIVLTLCMVFTMNSAVFATTAAQASDDTFTYVTLGASQTNGYGMRGYLDEEVYQNPDKFDKNTANVFGYERSPEAAYPSLIAKQLESDTGKDVELRQLAMSSMRAEEVRMLLDDSYNGDDYTKWRFSAGHNWFDRAGGVDQLRADYKDAVTKADLITVEVGVNNFGVYAINQIISGGKKFDTNLADITAPDKMETYNMIKGMIKPMIAGAAGVDEATVDLLADTFSYAYVGYKTSFDAIIAKIRELNPDTQIVVLGIPNMLTGVEAEMNGTVLPLGELFGCVVDLGNLYASTESPYLDEYLFATTGEAATFLEEAANYNGNPASLSINMKDCFDVYDDDLRLRSKVTAAMKGYTTAKYNKALNNAYDVAATICKAAANNNVIDLEAMLSDDFGDAEDKAMAYIEENVAAAITAAQKGKAFDFKFDNTLMNDPAVATAFSMGIRANFGNSFFAHPSEIGHQEVADAILEAIDFGITGGDAAATELSGTMNDLMALLLEVSPVMFDSHKQIVNKLKKAVNNLDSYAKAEQEGFAAVRAKYTNKNMNTVLNTVENDMKALRKTIKTAKSSIGTLVTAVNKEDVAAMDTAAATVAANIEKVDAAAAKLDDSIKAAVKKARELGLDNTALKPVAAEMSSYMALAYATTGIMKSDSREMAYAPTEDSYYVALGDKSAQYYKTGGSTYTKYSYVYKLKDELGLNYQNESMDGMRAEDLLYILDEDFVADSYSINTFGKNVATERADKIKEIQKADLITVGFSQTTMLALAIEQMNNNKYELDWTHYLDAATAAEILKLFDEIETTLTESGMGSLAETASNVIQGYIYGYLGFFKYYQEALNTVYDLNPDAKIILVGQYNPFREAVIEMNGSELPLGEYMEYLTELLNLQQRGFAMMTGKATYVEAPAVDLVKPMGTADINKVISSVVGLTNNVSANADGHTYIKDQILSVMNIVDADTAAAMDKMTGLYDLLNVTTANLNSAKSQIDAARKAYDALTAEQKAKIDEELVQLLEFCESDYNYVRALAVEKANVTNLKAKLPTKTKLTVSWTGVTGAEKYLVKIYRNGALISTKRTTAKTVSLTNINRGCTYKATVQPIGTYGGTEFTGVLKSATVTSALGKATITVSKKSSKVTLKSADQNSTGFEVWISKDKNFKKNVTKKKFSTNYNKLNKTVKLSTYFKKGTNYVKIRAYTTRNGKTTYGAFSARKSVKR